MIEDEKNDEFMKEKKLVSINFANYDEHENEFYYDKQTIAKENSNEIFIDLVNLKITC